MNNTPNLHHTVIAFLLLCTAFAAPTFGGTLFYNGDPNDNPWDATANHVADQWADMRFENFEVPTGQTWTATGAFAHIAESSPSSTNGFAWEIRTGLDGSSGGTRLHHGVADLTSSESTDYRNSIDPTRRVEITFPDPIDLPGGETYWLAVAPQVSGSTAQLLKTNGGNAINAPGGGSIHYAYGGYPVGWSEDPSAEYSLGLTTTATAPEPSTALLLLGLAPVLARRPRRRNRG